MSTMVNKSDTGTVLPSGFAGQNQTEEPSPCLIFAKELCKYAGKDDEFLNAFLKKLSDSPALLKEFSYYLDHQDFLCEMNIQGITIPDILVWQVDKFKAGIDEGRFELKYNADAMLLMAFDTMYDVERDPSKYLENFRTVTGSDYEDKIKGY
ncbi:MAG: hypothetical protein IKX95_02655 [Lachnospiraceae bacterium]|nr:hypothetical protein [Lachnospiraceae bacterium]